jgi:hypothetical protein
MYRSPVLLFKFFQIHRTEEIKQPLSKKAVTARPLLGGMAQGPLAFFFFALFTAKGKRTLSTLLSVVKEVRVL